MAEYIEREDAYNVLTEYYHHSTEVQHEALREAIERVPSADVQPVVKARWVYTNMSRLVCSNCGNPVAFSLKEDGWHHGDFCPNCGADMRGE